MKSSQLLLNFTVSPLERRHVDILSVFNDKLLVGSQGYSQLFIYSREGRYVSTFNIDDNGPVIDATWTPRGNIVYATYNDKLVVMSELGKVSTTQTHLKSIQKLHVSSDDIIYLTTIDWGISQGVYQSTDDGVSWSLVFNITDEFLFRKDLIKVATDHVDEFWILNRFDNYFLSVYCKDKRRSDGNVTRRIITAPLINVEHDDLLNGTLSYDGNMNIFLSDMHNKAVHVLLTNGQYHRQLLSSHQIKANPCILVVDKERQLLYIGESKGLVEVFKLTYGDGGMTKIYVLSNT